MGTLTLLALLRLTAAAPLTLDDALAMAAKRNAELAIARSDEQAAAVEARASYQGVLPRLDLAGAFGHQFEGAQQQVNVVPSGDPPPAPQFVRIPVTINANDFGAYQLGLNFNWTFFDGLSSWSFIAASRTRAQAAHRQLDESALRVAFEVTRRFYEVAKQERALEVLRETATLSEELVKRADALFSAGRGTKADTYSARANLANDQLAVRTQAVNLVRARSDLATVLGLRSNSAPEVVAPPSIAGGGLPPRQELPPVSALLAMARKTRPLLSAQKLSIEATEQDISRAQGAYWPLVGLQASYQKATPALTGRSGLFSSPSNQYVALAQVTLAWNLFAGGETRAGVERARVQARRAEALLQQGEESVSAEVTLAHEQVLALTDEAATVQQMLDAADGALRFARERLDARVGSQLEVRDAALKRTQAKLSWVNTVADLVVARADLNRAVGGSL